MPIDWLPAPALTKSSLISGLLEVIRERTGLQYLDSSFLDRLREDHLFILAYAFGCRNELAEKRMRQADEYRGLDRARAQAATQRAAEQRAHERQVVASLKVEISDAVLKALAEGLTKASDEEIIAKAEDRGIDSALLIAAVRKLTENQPKLTD